VDLCLEVAFATPGQGSARERNSVPVEFGNDRHVTVEACPKEADRTSRLAVNDVERALTMEAREPLTGVTEPGRISPWQPGMVVRCVDVVPSNSIDLLGSQPFGMTNRHDLDLMAGERQALREGSCVILHSADAVACDGDDANPQETEDVNPKRRLWMSSPSPQGRAMEPSGDLGMRASPNGLRSARDENACSSQQAPCQDGVSVAAVPAGPTNYEVAGLGPCQK
jgi:hypothetical protein